MFVHFVQMKIWRLCVKMSLKVQPPQFGTEHRKFSSFPDPLCSFCCRNLKILMWRTCGFNKTMPHAIQNIIFFIWTKSFILKISTFKLEFTYFLYHINFCNCSIPTHIQINLQTIKISLYKNDIINFLLKNRITLRRDLMENTLNHLIAMATSILHMLCCCSVFLFKF